MKNIKLDDINERLEEIKDIWPVATFLEAHICERRGTPIDGWFICKHCGTNLRIIK